MRKGIRFFTVPSFENYVPHISYLPNLTPVWIRTLDLDKVPRRENCAPHVSHLYGLSPFILRFILNIAIYNEQSCLIKLYGLAWHLLIRSRELYKHSPWMKAPCICPIFTSGLRLHHDNVHDNVRSWSSNRANLRLTWYFLMKRLSQH